MTKLTDISFSDTKNTEYISFYARCSRPYVVLSSIIYPIEWWKKTYETSSPLRKNITDRPTDRPTTDGHEVKLPKYPKVRVIRLIGVTEQNALQEGGRRTEVREVGSVSIIK